MGFDKALSTWRALARLGGYLVVSELSWFRPDSPAEIGDFWQRHYLAMRGVEENLAAAQNVGWTCVGNFPLPAAAWDRYHAPLMDRYADFCGYELFVLRRGAQNPRERSATC